MRLEFVLATIVWLSGGAPAVAQTVATAVNSEAVAPASATFEPTTPVQMADEDLAALRAGDEVTVSVISNQQLTALTANNTVTAGVLNSGAITFDPNALANFSGIGNFVLNTGANNSLQGAISITIMASPVMP